MSRSRIMESIAKLFRVLSMNSVTRSQQLIAERLHEWLARALEEHIEHPTIVSEIGRCLANVSSADGT